jgi:hypothetical protein
MGRRVGGGTGRDQFGVIDRTFVWEARRGDFLRGRLIAGFLGGRWMDGWMDEELSSWIQGIGGNDQCL